MATSTRVAIGVVVLAAMVIVVALLFGPRLPTRPGGPSRVCNGGFEEGGFVKEGVLAGQDVMHVPAGSRAMFCDADRSRGWLAVRPNTPAQSEAAAWFQFQGAPPSGVGGRRIVDLTGFYDSPPFGAVSQEFVTAPGDEYEVLLTLLNDPGFGPPSVTVTVGNSGNPRTTIQSASFTAPRPVAQIQGYRARLVFRAQAIRTYIEISGNSPNQSIPIDDVSVRVFCVFGLDRFCR
jgi:hypothetical protein